MQHELHPLCTVEIARLKLQLQLPCALPQRPLLLLLPNAVAIVTVIVILIVIVSVIALRAALTTATRTTNPQVAKNAFILQQQQQHHSLCIINATNWFLERNTHSPSLSLSPSLSAAAKQVICHAPCLASPWLVSTPIE